MYLSFRLNDFARRNFADARIKLAREETVIVDDDDATFRVQSPYAPWYERKNTRVNANLDASHYQEDPENNIAKCRLSRIGLCRRALF